MKDKIKKFFYYAMPIICLIVSLVVVVAYIESMFFMFSFYEELSAYMDSIDVNAPSPIQFMFVYGLFFTSMVLPMVAYSWTYESVCLIRSVFFKKKEIEE